MQERARAARGDFFSVWPFSVTRVIICMCAEFLRRFEMKSGIHFTHFVLESGMVLEGTTGVYERIYRFNYKRVKRK